jgi:hypothetical protein
MVVLTPQTRYSNERTQQNFSHNSSPLVTNFTDTSYQ